MAEITKDGATGTTLNSYLTVMRQRYLDIDDGWNINPESPDGLVIAAWCETLANLDEEVINAYHSVDPNSAIGQQLDRIAAFAGITRQDATFSTATVVFTGTALVEIPAGTLVRNRVTNMLWATDTTVATDNSGIATVNATCTTAGAQGANSDNLSIIATPIGGITSVTNLDAASLGTDEETDDAFRIRRNESVALPGNNQVDNIYAALVNLDSVKQVKIYENPDSEPDSNGVLAHSMAIFIDGGTKEDIVAALATNKNPGCGLNRYNPTIPNKTSVDTTTPVKKQPFNATFFRPEYVSIHVKVAIVSESLSSADDDNIKAAIVDYSVYGFLETSGFAKTGFRIGEDVAAGRLYTPINKIVGNDDYVGSILIGTSDSDITHTLLDLAFYQLGVFNADNIEITYGS
ncbi:baseplate J/gp47 family protein [Brenneria goodwinii]|uniref:Phage-related protein n=1 Tax=Brenneria goodwinii TaxID=1109412 RepID=A0A0G4K1A5_9GAMM|nr:baseplate J/gp47 family protein [Brenneria goodwinii]MCG8155202.1 baseplate J/gp47 family protein [Brenneria goodwinii]MCG8159446.1 baseplate J/gp47 family protein [Brenneria goodwinii]MCG8164385.1 baseplate J/gp47 family protein [Brenneria goodwinii]MCG8169049.1 baseplate J/gp47 family protein [Brenneria goodwinii]MCG8173305.1 baseplate J/gp47 family protein [Brenneria goodwinii]